MGTQPRTIDEIKADMARNRIRISESLGEAAASANPKRLAKEGVDKAKDFAKSEFDSAKQQFVDDNGVRLKQVLIAGGAVVGLIAFVVTLNAVTGSRHKQIEKELRKALEDAKK